MNYQLVSAIQALDSFLDEVKIPDDAMFCIVRGEEQSGQALCLTAKQVDAFAQDLVDRTQAVTRHLSGRSFPFSVSRQNGRTRLSFGGLEADAARAEAAVGMLEVVNLVASQLHPDDGGDNLYHIGKPGTNLVTDGIGTFCADSAGEAVAKLIATRLIATMDESASSSEVIVVGDRELEVVRAHDWKKLDYWTVFTMVSGLFDIERDCQREIREQERGFDLTP